MLHSMFESEMTRNKIADPNIIEKDINKYDLIISYPEEVVHKFMGTILPIMTQSLNISLHCPIPFQNNLVT